MNFASDVGRISKNCESKHHASLTGPTLAMLSGALFLFVAILSLPEAQVGPYCLQGSPTGLVC